MYGHQYTPKEKDFFEDYIPGHTYKEIQATFKVQFGWDITISQIKGYMANHKINNGLTGRFSKGHVPQNKGKKGVCPAGCQKGWFRKGNIPKNHRAVGSERIAKDGYIEVKVAEPNQWREKHRVVWEQHNGPIPVGMIVIFVDGDRQNVSIDNLRLIEKGTNAVINHEGLAKYTGEFKDTVIAIADMKRAIRKKKRRQT